MTRASKGKLGGLISDLKSEHKVSLEDLTVLSTSVDPYRLDTKSGHRDGQWFKEQFDRAIGSRDSLHLRGVHYAIVSRCDVLKPNGLPYRNTDADWTWLQVFPGKCARWLGYVDFSKIHDGRNDPPIVHRRSAVEPQARIRPGSLTIELPDPDDIKPEVNVYDFKGRQPYHLVIFGEKSSLAEILLPIAKRYDADLYLPTGEITDTLMYLMARDGAQDGRPMRVFTLSDADPSGHQMPISIGRKLQALKDLEFPGLDFEVRPLALTVDQVRELGLPSRPLKESEKRADRWREAFGVEQTEVDALGTLRPEVLRQIVDAALTPFYDKSLDHSVYLAQRDWRDEAQRRLDERIDPEPLAALHDQAEDRLRDIRAQVEALADELYVPIPDDLELPEIVIPEPVVDEKLQRNPLVSSSWSWLEQTAALKAHKAYDGGDE